MSSIREQLEKEKQAYRSAQYVGDLAADAMPEARPLNSKGFDWIAAAGAIAAVVTISVLLYTRPQPQVAEPRATPLVLATRPAPVEESLWSPPSVAAVSLSDVGGAPSLGAMPSFPSLSDAKENQ